MKLIRLILCKYNFLLIITLSLMFICICTITFAQTSEKIVLKNGLVSPIENPTGRTSVWMAEELEKRTNGQIELKNFPSSTLGNETEMIEGVRMGTVDMVAAGGSLGAWVEKIRVIDMPYVIDSTEHFKRCFLDPGVVGAKLAEEVLKEAGLKVMAWYGQGFRITVCRKQPIMKLEDFKGIKIRTSENPLVVSTFRALGAQAVPMAFGEVYTSLNTGLIDAMESPPSTIGVNRLCEVAPYISHTNHFFLITALVISEKKFNSLPSDIQKILLDVCKESQYYMLSILDEVTQTGLDLMRALPTLETWPDLKPWKEAVKPVVKEYSEKYKVMDLVEEIEKQR